MTIEHVLYASSSFVQKCTRIFCGSQRVIKGALLSWKLQWRIKSYLIPWRYIAGFLWIRLSPKPHIQVSFASCYRQIWVGLTGWFQMSLPSAGAMNLTLFLVFYGMGPLLVSIQDLLSYIMPLLPSWIEGSLGRLNVSIFLVHRQGARNGVAVDYMVFDWLTCP